MNSTQYNLLERGRDVTSKRSGLFEGFIRPFARRVLAWETTLRQSNRHISFPCQRVLAHLLDLDDREFDATEASPSASLNQVEYCQEYCQPEPSDSSALVCVSFSFVTQAVLLLPPWRAPQQPQTQT